MQQVLTLKTAARESELRRMTSDLSEFIQRIPTADTDAQFIQNLMLINGQKFLICCVNIMPK